MHHRLVAERRFALGQGQAAHGIHREGADQHHQGRPDRHQVEVGADDPVDVLDHPVAGNVNDGAGHIGPTALARHVAVERIAHEDDQSQEGGNEGGPGLAQVEQADGDEEE